MSPNTTSSKIHKECQQVKSNENLHIMIQMSNGISISYRDISTNTCHANSISHK